MKIRTLSAKDAEVYRVIRLEGLKLHPEAFGSSYEEEVDNTIEDYGKRLGNELHFTYGAFEGDSLVGVVTLVPEGKRKMRHRANIYAMYVAPDVRGKGTARLLMEAAISKGRELEQIEQIHLTVTASNEPAKRLYTSLGFKTYGLDQKALKLGNLYFDEELMVLPL